MSTCKANEIDNSIRVLHDMLKCNGACAGDYNPHFNLKLNPEAYLEWQQKNMPALRYVTSRIGDYIFSNGFTSGDEKIDAEVLDPWMYGMNAAGVTNYNVLRSAFNNTAVFGHWGVRWLDEERGITTTNCQHYGEILDELPDFPGVKVPIGYLVSTDGEYIYDIDLTDLEYSAELLEEYGIVASEDHKIIILSPEEFMNMKWDPDDPEGRSPLFYDRQRLDLLLSVYTRLNYDIEYDGPGRIILSLANNVGDDWGNETSTSSTVGRSEAVKTDKINKARKELSKLGSEIKNSSSDAVIALSNIFSEKITHLPRVTKGTEFFDYIGTEGEILCQVYGVPPALLELGKVFGNVSMQKIIDNAIVNSIVPIRERFATQISNFIAPKLGLNKIFFNKYELEQVEDDNNETRAVVADIISTLKDAGYDELADQFAALLEDDIDIAGEPAELKVKKKDNHFYAKLGGEK